MKKCPSRQSNESAKDKGHLTANQEKFRQKLIKDLFPEKAKTCFECGTKLTNSNRKRIVTVHRLPEGVVFSGHQLCRSCAALMQAGELQKLPKINSDVAAARFEFMGADVKCVGGLQ